MDACAEFLLAHELYRSHRTGETINGKFLMLSYPCRWKYDLLRALDRFARAGRPRDQRTTPALEMLAGKRRADGTWPLQNRHPGAGHCEMEAAGQPQQVEHAADGPRHGGVRRSRELSLPTKGRGGALRRPRTLQPGVPSTTRQAAIRENRN